MATHAPLRLERQALFNALAEVYAAEMSAQQQVMHAQHRTHQFLQWLLADQAQARPDLDFRHHAALCREEDRENAKQLDQIEQKQFDASAHPVETKHIEHPVPQYVPSVAEQLVLAPKVMQDFRQTLMAHFAKHGKPPTPAQTDMLLTHYGMFLDQYLMSHLVASHVTPRLMHAHFIKSFKAFWGSLQDVFADQPQDMLHDQEVIKAFEDHSQKTIRAFDHAVQERPALAEEFARGLKDRFQFGPEGQRQVAPFPTPLQPMPKPESQKDAAPQPAPKPVAKAPDEGGQGAVPSRVQAQKKDAQSALQTSFQICVVPTLTPHNGG